MSGEKHFRGAHGRMRHSGRIRLDGNRSLPQVPGVSSSGPALSSPGPVSRHSAPVVHSGPGFVTTWLVQPLFLAACQLAVPRPELGVCTPVGHVAARPAWLLGERILAIGAPVCYQARVRALFSLGCVILVRKGTGSSLN